MRQYFSYILLGSSALLFFFTFFASDGAEQLNNLLEQKRFQEQERARVGHRVDELRGVLVGMEENPRVLEKVAREQLKVARENETVVLFDSPLGRR